MDVYQTLEFSKIQDELVSFSKSERGKELILSLRMSTSKEDIKQSLNELDEMINLVSRYSSLPLASSAHLLHTIEIAKKTALLTPIDLNHVLTDIELSEKLIVAFRKVETEFPLLSRYISSMNDLSNLKGAIKKVITPSLTVSDNASPKLKEIRQVIKKLEANLTQRISSISFTYSDYLNDKNVTIRDGHFVLPVKTSYKNKVLGVIFDVSDTGNTTFIEPLEIVQLNNDITSKKLEENEEVRRILKELTSLVLLQEEEVLHNNEIISIIDFINAKANYALKIDAKVASISDKQEIDLLEARHPLIDPKKVVANNYHLDEEKRIVIISGPNAGGKTVSLKTVGLLTLMNQCALAIPVKDAKLGIFNNIYLDIGDGQSLSDNLSTFSSHMSNISHILDLSKGKDLVLLDELGTGTDPKEGEVIGLTIIRELEKRHSLAMVSSHYSKIKEYAFNSEFVENSSMLFDEKNLSPTYIYKYQVPGKSYGLEVASRYGIDEKALKDTKEKYFSNDHSKFEDELTRLNSLIEENERLKRQNEIDKQNIEKEKKALQNASNNLKNKKEHLLEEVKDEKEQILDDLNEKIDEIIKSLSSGDLKLHEAIKLKKEVEELRDSEVVISYNEDIKVNDYVSFPSLNLEGKVIRIKGNKAHLLSNDGMAIDVDISTLHKIDAPKVNKVRNSDSNYENRILTDVGLELNIIGLRRDEAKEALIKYLDTCKVKKIKQVRIIHGFGNGILRKMTHEYLDSQKMKYRLGDINEGGGGATVVTLYD